MSSHPVFIESAQGHATLPIKITDIFDDPFIDIYFPYRTYLAQVLLHKRLYNFKHIFNRLIFFQLDIQHSLLLWIYNKGIIAYLVFYRYYCTV